MTHKSSIRPKGHWSERGRVTSVANADALGRPRRSVLAFGIITRMPEFTLTPWIWTLGIGLPVFAVVAAILRRRAQQSAWWRFVVCFVLACAIAPSLFPWTNGHNAGGVILIPAVLMFADMIQRGSEAVFGALILGALPLCIVSFVLLGIWSALIRRRKRDA